MLDQYLDAYRPKDFMFEGASGAEYSPSSLQNIIREAATKAGITKHTTMNTLSHSFATYCLENGINQRYIQSMLGHENIKTTETCLPQASLHTHHYQRFRPDHQIK